MPKNKENEFLTDYNAFLKGCMEQYEKQKEVFGPETQKAHDRRNKAGFYKKYCQGKGLDIGFAGYVEGSKPITNSIGIDRDYPGYDGINLPFSEGSQDFVYSSHCLEHIEDYKGTIKEWHRVVKVGGFIIITVPHQYLYEKRASLPSQFNADHKRFYTGTSLLREIEESLLPNSYRIVYLQDCDNGFDYNIPVASHSSGEYQIELVLKKIETPKWSIE